MVKAPRKPPTAPHFSAAFARQTERFRRLLKETRENADAKNVHQLRVSTRRLRAALAIARSLGGDGKSERKAQKRLKKLGKALGAWREADVLQQDLAAFGLASAAVSAGPRASRKIIRDELPSGKKFARELRQVEEHLRQPGRRPFEKIVSDLRLKVEALQAADFARPEELHLLRIQIKKIRYSFEIMGLPVEELKGLQRLLGELHDAEVLAEYLRKRGAQVPEKLALAVVERRRQERLEAARRKIRPTLAATRKLLPH